MNWSEFDFDGAVAILSRYTKDEYDEAFEDIYAYSEGRGEEVDGLTKKSLKDAFRRQGLQGPTHFLRAVSYEDAEDENIVGSPITIATDGVTMVYRGRTIFMPAAAVSRFSMFRSAKAHGGMGFTINETQARLKHEYGLTLHRKDISLLSRELRIFSFSKPLPYSEIVRSASIEDTLIDKEVSILREGNLKGQVRAYNKRLHQLTEEVSELLDIHSIIEEGQQTYIEVPKVYRGSHVSLIIPVSDLHVGATFKKKGSYGAPIDEFDREVLLQRVANMLNYIDLGVSTLNAHSIGEVVIAGLGDGLEALLGNMREGQHFSMDLHGIEQLNLLEDLYTIIAEHVASKVGPDVPITFILQGGNHDRLTKDKAAQTELIVVAQMVKVLSLRLAQHKNLKVVFGAPVCSFTLANGVNIITKHGHLDNSNGLGESGVLRLKELHGDKLAKRTIVLQGHLHRYSQISFYNTKSIVNPSVVGSTDYAMNNILKGAPPEFIMVVSGENQDITLGPYDLRFATL